MTDHRVPDGVGAIALPRYLARAYPMLPGWAARNALKGKDVRVNGARWDGRSPVRGGDRITLYVPGKYLTGDLQVLREDEHLLGIVKPAGLPVDVDELGIGADTVLTRARNLCPQARLCHRLDAGTGGAMVLAKTDAGEARMRRAFEAHLVKKTYRALVAGAPPAHGQLTHYLIKDGSANRVRALDKPAPGALTGRLGYNTLAVRGDRALLEIDLYTGRTHQIRAQLARIGHPLLGDDKYGDRALNKRYGLAQPLLWCVRLAYEDWALVSDAPQWLEDD